jgi:hypothetical protein
LSLVGTFGVMYALGYSLDNLSLMALTISTGFVVDDAIVMIENISRYLEEGDSPMQAALKGAEQIGFTIMSLTVSADRSADSAAVYGRRGGAAVPRVCGNSGGYDCRFRHLSLVDADADDVSRIAAAYPKAQQGRVLSGLRAFFEYVIAKFMDV